MATGTKNPLLEVLQDRNFRNFWIANILISGVSGTVRFSFVWLIVTLTDWPGAEGNIGIALGIPAVLFSIPAGAWSDRLDRRRYFLGWAAAAAVTFAGFGFVVASGQATPVIAGIAALFVGTMTVVLAPNLSAIAPLLVPPERLMNAVALQNGGGQAAGFLGLFIGGGLIQLFGNAAGFFMLALACLVAIWIMWGVEIPARASDKPRRSVRSEIVEGLRYGLGAEPRRTLLVSALILGSSFSVLQIAMPRVVEEEFGKQSLAAGLLLGTFGIGMLISSAVVAGLRDMKHGRNVAIFIGVGLGLGQFTVSFAPNYWVAVAIMVAWGMNAGIAIASHRTLLQQSTEPAMMGRVMGIMILGFSGGLPFGAFAQTVLAPRYGPVMTMRIVGFTTMCITIPLLWRKVIRTA